MDTRATDLRIAPPRVLPVGANSTVDLGLSARRGTACACPLIDRSSLDQRERDTWIPRRRWRGRPRRWRLGSRACSSLRSRSADPCPCSPVSRLAARRRSRTCSAEPAQTCIVSASRLGAADARKQFLPPLPGAGPAGEADPGALAFVAERHPADNAGRGRAPLRLRRHARRRGRRAGCEVTRPAGCRSRRSAMGATVPRLDVGMARFRPTRPHRLCHRLRVAPPSGRGSCPPPDLRYSKLGGSPVLQVDCTRPRAGQAIASGGRRPSKKQQLTAPTSKS